MRASDTFPGDRHLVELWSSNSKKLDRTESPQDDEGLNDMKAQNNAIYYEDITFRDILFDSSYRGGGLFIIDSARTRINNCISPQKEFWSSKDTKPSYQVVFSGNIRPLAATKVRGISQGLQLILLVMTMQSQMLQFSQQQLVLC